MAFFQQFFNRPNGLSSRMREFQSLLIVVTVNQNVPGFRPHRKIRHVHKRGTLQTNVNERRLHARKHFHDFPLIHVAHKILFLYSVHE